MDRILSKIRQFIKEKKFEEAFKLIENAEAKNILSPELSILKARILQLSDFGDYELDDIEKLYKRALLIDENSIYALIEIGYFYYAIMDNSKLAEKYFKKALGKCKTQMTEIVIGLAKCKEEYSVDSALKFLEKVRSQTLEFSKLDDLRKDFEY
ncbi:MAG: hypothetical protein SGI89_00010 [bacterium]|nr:hypothetical protein [bacterium]